jgi:hypothetical protein
LDGKTDVLLRSLETQNGAIRVGGCLAQSVSRVGGRVFLYFCIFRCGQGRRFRWKRSVSTPGSQLRIVRGQPTPNMIPPQLCAISRSCSNLKGTSNDSNCRACYEIAHLTRQFVCLAELPPWTCWTSSSLTWLYGREVHELLVHHLSGGSSSRQTNCLVRCAIS